MLDYCENTPKYEHNTHHFQSEKCPSFAISSVPIQATAEKIYNFTPQTERINLRNIVMKSFVSRFAVERHDPHQK